MASKTIPIIGVLVVLLVAIGVVIVTQHDKQKSNNNNVNESEKTIQQLCQFTDYKKTCVETLNKSTNSSDPKTLVQVSFRAAMEEITNVTKQLLPIQEASQNPQTARAYAICQNFLNDSIYDLQRTLDRIDSFQLDDVWIVMDDINTWLSGALTYQETCLDTLEEAEPNSSIKVRGLLQPSREITINCFSLTDQFSKLPQNKQEGRSMAARPDVTARSHKLLRANGGAVKPDVVVAKDGSGKYRTISEALQEVPYRSNDTFVIYIKQGVYKEYVKINNTMWSVMLLGDGPTKTKITGNRSVKGNNLQTFDTATLFVGGDNFIGKDIGIENTAGGEMHQAVAVIVDADKALFYNCQIDGYQDTLCTHAHRQFYRDCTITGTVDFIFGNGRAVLQNCTLIVRKPLENQECMVTADGRDEKIENTGIAIQSCRIIPAPDYPVNVENYATFLGRPWKPYSRTVVMDSQLDAFIDPAGWKDWNDTAKHLHTCWYAEVNNWGAGANLASRVALPGIKHLSGKEAEYFTPGKWLGDYWIAGLGIPYSSGRIMSKHRS